MYVLHLHFCEVHTVNQNLSRRIILFKTKHLERCLMLLKGMHTEGTSHELKSIQEASSTKNVFLRVCLISTWTAMICALSRSGWKWSDPHPRIQHSPCCNYSPVGHKQSLHYCPCHKQKCVPLISHLSPFLAQPPCLMSFNLPSAQLFQLQTQFLPFTKFTTQK